ncbi:SDR family NAD(P)-dependent oxidoreductase [Dactylosporangium aurantiacum]|uniref:SDR family NAD(P)-dependent oxidoreductase n=1 Tax=Dactylosporangium aurantiacum TaxID=35754 RepID=A0A9Q9MJ67_9ACTN|nr:SDR family NAD(P)-dependent oxidoreductase [Dactylosporangium aurantiacum]MDG6110441.1 SDR family NAD(P)-dependent oxidoreductase [Dactylosporangium aurantiacum]UWZ58674.1 SDR family NAD(P)-dependent oxidoreductase [Dactylosporangium aurantiacum]
MEITGSIAVVTGANRGLGRALVDALLARGAVRVYAAARDPRAVLAHERVTPVALDVTDRAAVDRVAALATDTNLLINNAGAAAFAPALDADPDGLDCEFAVNYTGLYDMIRAFAPALTANKGALVNVLTLLAYAPAPPMAGYSASKAAAHSLTLALRPALTRAGVSVHGVYPGGIDTDMLTGVDAPKAAPRAVADAILDGITAGGEDIYPDPTSAQMGALWSSDPRALTAAFAAMGS